MKVKIVATGSSRLERLIRRWGVSFLVGEDLLFDAFGDPGALLNNIRKFNVDVAKIKHIVLSHDDWDHISGLWYLLPSCRDITIYICPGFKQEIKDRIIASGARVVEVRPFMEIKENIFSSGQMEASSSGRVIFEQALIIKFLKSLSIVTGCAHPGIVNIVDRVRRYFPEERIYAILGGLHLKDNPRKVNLDIIGKLRRAGISKIVPMHCTGRNAIKMIRERFGPGFLWAREGDTINL